MTHSQTYQAWREIESAVDAAAFLLQHADCNGPLSDRPTQDAGVRLVMAARRHLLSRACRIRRFLFVQA